ncbi:MAG: mechanosensitive ion channel family protein [Parcubacteria group bacterium]|nr:mechanosensitive ion channel family protein [Parcubacteria group bacterium]MCR4342866.1 mechanosensitive ion channel family protein [Patescibacteria group bacterium]
MNFWDYKILENTTQDYILAILAFAVFVFLFRLFQDLVIRRLKNLAKKTKTDIDDTLIKIVHTIKPQFYYFVAFYFATYFLYLSSTTKKVINVILLVWITYQAIVIVGVLIDYTINRYIKSGNGAESKSAIRLLGKIAKGALWLLGILLVLSNLGINITSLIAGLGIGGIAVALALQNILMDLFSSFAIHFDKPFVPGDFIVVGSNMGTVEKIGIKTTRIRALQGEEIIISNQELTSARIQNFKKMEKRRIVFSFGVVYETTQEKLEKIPNIIENIIKSIEMADFGRAHFHKFDDSALTFEVVYFVKTPDYNEYMDINQKIHLGIKGEFEKEGISMAYPTQTIYMNNNKI